MLSMSRRLAVVASAVSVLAVGAPVAGASAATSTVPVTPLPPVTLPQLPSWALTFTPPWVGPIEVHIGPVIISGNVISPGVNVVMPPITLPPLLFHPAG